MNGLMLVFSSLPVQPLLCVYWVAWLTVPSGNIPRLRRAPQCHTPHMTLTGGTERARKLDLEPKDMK